MKMLLTVWLGAFFCAPIALLSPETTAFPWTKIFRPQSSTHSRWKAGTDGGLPPRAEYADSKSRELAQVGCECGRCQRGAEAVPVILRFCSPPGLGCVFADTGVKTVSQNKKHPWWGREPHNTHLDETKNFYPVYYPPPTQSM